MQETWRERRDAELSQVVRQTWEQGLLLRVLLPRLLPLRVRSGPIRLRGGGGGVHGRGGDCPVALVGLGGEEARCGSGDGEDGCQSLSGSQEGEGG